MQFDLILAGGGLVGGLIAMRLAETRPALRVAIVEAGERIGGNHIWSSFDSDMSREQRQWTAPLYGPRWDGYEVRFPQYSRAFGTGYASVRSERLDAAVRECVPAERIFAQSRIARVEPRRVLLEDGRQFGAKGVIDARGHGASPHLDLRWQKFVGTEIETARPHGRVRPVVMDAAVPQIDGYRFVYTLPMSATGLLVEDTYYSDGPELDDEAIRRRIRDYAAAEGLGDHREGRSERGILPLALGGDIEAFWGDGGVPKAGMAAALFHPVTGYSFPDAVDTADLVAGLERIESEALYRALKADSTAKWRGRGYYRMLNRMMFDAAEPSERYRVLQHFYKLDQDLVERFYAGETSMGDRLRILMGRPPVPIGRAVKVLMGSVR